MGVLRDGEVIQFVSKRQKYGVDAQDCLRFLIQKVHVFFLLADTIKLPEGEGVAGNHQQHNYHETKGQPNSDPELASTPCPPQQGGRHCIQEPLGNMVRVVHSISRASATCRIRLPGALHLDLHQEPFVAPESLLSESVPSHGQMQLEWRVFLSSKPSGPR